jgi:hypothetical protein
MGNRKFYFAGKTAGVELSGFSIFSRLFAWDVTHLVCYIPRFKSGAKKLYSCIFQQK